MQRKLVKSISIPGLGFGLGGFFWGLILYSELPNLEYPFHFMAILGMGLFGGISLIWPDWKDIRKVSKAVLVGFLGWAVAFFVIGVLMFPLFISGILLLSILPFYFIGIDFLTLVPDISIGDFWLLFLIAGLVIGLFYALFLKLKIWPLVWRAGIGFALGSLIGPILGNLIGNWLNSVLLTYLITFSVIGLILGKFIGWGISK